MSQRVTVRDVLLLPGDRRHSLRDRRGAGRLFGLVYAVYRYSLSPDRGDRLFRDTKIRSPKMNSANFALTEFSEIHCIANSPS
jgi:hypothetical protein